MRNIKFRGKTLNGDWTYGYLLENCSGIYRIGTPDNYPIIDIKTVGQLTSLRDKNGVEIYEGDILLDWDERMCEVYQCGSGGWCAGPEYIWENISDDGKENDYVVIGNSCDNPEMLWVAE